MTQPRVPFMDPLELVRAERRKRGMPVDHLDAPHDKKLRDAKVIRMHRDGASMKAIALAVGLTEKATYQALRRRGVIVPKPRRKVAPAPAPTLAELSGKRTLRQQVAALRRQAEHWRQRAEAAERTLQELVP